MANMKSVFFAVNQFGNESVSRINANYLATKGQTDAKSRIGISNRINNSSRNRSERDRGRDRLSGWL